MYLFTDKFYCRTTEPQSPEEVSKALQNLEDFCNTVDLGQTENPNRAKMIFYEAILYFLNQSYCKRGQRRRRLQCFMSCTSRMSFAGRNSWGSIGKYKRCDWRVSCGIKWKSKNYQQQWAGSHCNCLNLMMAKLPIISGKKAIEAFRNVGWLPVRQTGSHVIMIRENYQLHFQFHCIKKWKEAP